MAFCMSPNGILVKIMGTQWHIVGKKVAQWHIVGKKVAQWHIVWKVQSSNGIPKVTQWHTVVTQWHFQVIQWHHEWSPNGIPNGVNRGRQIGVRVEVLVFHLCKRSLGRATHGPSRIVRPLTASSSAVRRQIYRRLRICGSLVWLRKVTPINDHGLTRG